MLSSMDWQAPGPGLWEMDESHQSAPYSTYMVELMKAGFNVGMVEGAERYGSLIERFDIRPINGWIYMRPRIVAAPEKPGPLPPRWFFRLLFRLHPALRRRTHAAKRALTNRAWLADANWWLNEGREPMRARLAALQEVDPAWLSDEELAAHLDAVSLALAHGMRVHFRNALAHWIGVGDWLASTAEWTDVPPNEALLALAGASPASIDAVSHVSRISAAVRGSAAAREALLAQGSPAERLNALRSSSTSVAEALDDYIAEHGWRIYTGFDLVDKAVIELPDKIVETIAAHLEQKESATVADSFALELRAKVPAAHLAEYDDLFETARVLYGLRDDDAGMCVHWTLGLARRQLLEIGARLNRRNQIEAQGDIFEATPAEIEPLLLAGSAGPKGADLARRRESRKLSATRRPPARLGEDEGPPPPDDWLPRAVARVNKALMTAMAVEYPQHAAGKPDAAAKLKGLSASKGRYEGRACVVRGSEDFGKLQAGDILVASFTTTAYNVILPLLGGVVTEKGGVLSHAAIVAREFAIPAIVNVAGATTQISDGVRLRIDGGEGTVEVVEAPAAAASAL